MSHYTATYSPDDNKLRLYSISRLDADTYESVKAAGFRWAPKQQFFVAPMWTPQREDLLMTLCGEIGDEDTSLVQRAEERAERFEDYGESRSKDAERAQSVVNGITANIPFGQPILVGHHSERHARKDAARIDSGIRKAIKMWETAEYWKQRAAGALSHAKYKERADVRHRRIKTIESAKRKETKNIRDAETFLTLWRKDGLTAAQALSIANFSHISRCFPLADYPREAPASQYEGAMGLWSALDGGVITAEQARDIATAAYTRNIAHARRWVEHYDHRLSYERAMIGEQGGIAAETGGEDGKGFIVAVGGRVLVRGEWVTVLRVNKSGGNINSVTTNRKYVSVVGIEEVKDYQAPTVEDVAKMKAATKQPALCNYPGEGFVVMTAAEWKDKSEAHSGIRVVDKMPDAGIHRARFLFSYKSGYSQRTQVFLSDATQKVAPPLCVEGEPAAALPAPQRVQPRAVYEAPQTPELDGLRERLSAGVQVVSAPQLFPTPYALATRMVELAHLDIGARVLEPSAGTGAILQALPGVMPFAGQRQTACEVVAVEVNQALASGLVQSGLAQTVKCADFLQCDASLGRFDAVLMNPPFVNAEDVKHIMHALTMLKQGGRLVAICANGPRQQAALGPLVSAHGGTWEALPADTFQESGTSVHAALITLTA